jgi:hypothetical protein
MRNLLRETAVALLLAGIVSGCYSPAEQEAIRRTWAERDAERAQECQRRGMPFVAGSCGGYGGGP